MPEYYNPNERYSAPDPNEDANGYSEHLAQVWKQLQTLPPSILSAYLEQTLNPVNMQGQQMYDLPNLTSVLEQALVNYPSSSQNPSFTGTGYQAGQNQTGGMTIIDMINLMGQGNQVTPRTSEQGDIIGTIGGQEIGNDWEQPTHDWLPPDPENPPTIPGQGPYTGPTTTTTTPTQDGNTYDFMFSKEMLRNLTNDLVGGTKGLSPYTGNPFSFSGNTSPVVGDTRNIMNTLIQRYRGL